MTNAAQTSRVRGCLHEYFLSVACHRLPELDPRMASSNDIRTGKATETWPKHGAWQREWLGAA